MENLSNVKVGDILIVRNNFRRRALVVSRVTKTMVVVGKYRFRKSDGGAVGEHDSFYRTQAYIPKDGEIEEIERERLVNYIKGKLSELGDKVTYDQAIKVKEIFKW